MYAWDSSCLGLESYARTGEAMTTLCLNYNFALDSYGMTTLCWNDNFVHMSFFCTILSLWGTKSLIFLLLCLRFLVPRNDNFVRTSFFCTILSLWGTKSLNFVLMCLRFLVPRTRELCSNRRSNDNFVLEWQICFEEFFLHYFVTP